MTCYTGAMNLSKLEQEVVEYYGWSTARYLAGWDPNHIHFGIFDPARNPLYATNLSAALADRPSATAAMTDRVLNQTVISPEDRIVDAGCGVGGTTLILARRGCRITGVNFSEKQLEIARSRAQEEGLSDRADFVWANCSRHLPFDDASVGVVVNIESACHYPDRPRFMAEVARILKPGGRICAQDWIQKEDPAPDERARLEALGRAWHLGMPLESLSSYQQMAASAGLRMVESTWLGDEGLANGLLLAHVWTGLRSFPDRVLTPQQREEREQARTFADTFLEGLLGLGIYLAVKEG